jgi:hypothetical protein
MAMPSFPFLRDAASNFKILCPCSTAGHTINCHKRKRRKDVIMFSTYYFLTKRKLKMKTFASCKVVIFLVVIKYSNERDPDHWFINNSTLEWYSEGHRHCLGTSYQK